MTDTTQRIPFHLAFPVREIAEARTFYGDLMGCPEGRSATDWVDFDFYGRQIVAHLAPDECGHKQSSAVDGRDVPVKHFGAILPMDKWQAMADRLVANTSRHSASIPVVTKARCRRTKPTTKRR